MTYSQTLPRWLIKKVPLLDGSYEKDPLMGRALDHFERRRDAKTGETIYISQPYGPLDYQMIKNMVAVCEAHGLEFEISSDSDHYPKWTVKIEWRTKK